MGAMNELINRGMWKRWLTILVAAAPGSRGPAWPRQQHLDELSLRGRTDQVSGALVADLPARPGRTMRRRLRLPRALDNPGFTGWILWPVSETAVTLALESDGPRTSMTAWRCWPSSPRG